MPSPGDTVTYTYVVTNTGDTTLYNVSVDDDVIGHIGDIDQSRPGPVGHADEGLRAAGGPARRDQRGHGDGQDVLGKTVTDDDDASVTIVKAAHSPPTQPPTAFTGSDAARLGYHDGPAGLGALALRPRRRRRDDAA